jgi:hypothetical protein
MHGESNLSEYMQGDLTEEQSQQVQKKVAQWETRARRSLEASCGHSIDASNLFPYLKFVPTCASSTPACHAIHVNVRCREARSKVVDSGSSCVGNPHHMDSAAQRTHLQVPELAGTVEVSVTCAIRVFLVAQEPIGRLPPCVHVQFEVADVLGACPQSYNPHLTWARRQRGEVNLLPHSADKIKPKECSGKGIGETSLGVQQGVHTLFHQHIFHTWASHQLKQFKLLHRMFCAMDPDGTGACSLQDAKYVFNVVYGASVISAEQQRTLFTAFKGTPLRDTASRVAGSHERFRCVAMNCLAISFKSLVWQGQTIRIRLAFGSNIGTNFWIQYEHIADHLWHDCVCHSGTMLSWPPSSPLWCCCGMRSRQWEHPFCHVTHPAARFTSCALFQNRPSQVLVPCIAP